MEEEKARARRRRSQPAPALRSDALAAVITPLFHNFWAMPEAQQMMQKQAFWKNLAVLGGLLFVYAFGPGAWSIDGRKRA